MAGGESACPECTKPRVQTPALPKLDMVAHNSNLNTWEVEAGGSEVYRHPRLYSKFETSLDYMRPYVNNNTGCNSGPMGQEIL